MGVSKFINSFFVQSPEDARIRRRAGVSLSLSDTEAETDLDYRIPRRNTSHQKFFNKFEKSSLEM